ncbi:MAG: C10 family peptidase [Muribaculaceae bacterium]
MKKLILALLCIAMSVPAWAAQIDVTAASATAKRFARSSSVLKSNSLANGDLELAYTATRNGKVMFYVFNRVGGGFVIAAGDDVASPVLGYSENGTFSIDAINDNLRYWLGSYADEISHAIDVEADEVAEVAVETSTPVRRSIPPLVTARWNQGAPYNDQCPKYDDTRNCVTGCVATAMAQVMYYHKWPAVGTGSNSYSTTINETTQTLSADFSKISFDWDNMTDTYDDSYSTTAQKLAVSTLMMACGYSTNMQYALSSGTQSGRVADALLKYFDYDRSIRHYDRDMIEIDRWEEIIYGELAAKRPVIYFGQSDGGGHCFVCDGYSSDAYYHFNWGWGGMSDGYFLLTALNPGSQGIGGSSTGNGYNSQQGIIAGIQKNMGSTDSYGMLVGQGNFACQTTSVSASSTDYIGFQCGSGTYGFGSTSHYDASIARLLGITNTATGQTIYYDTQAGSDKKENYRYSSYGSAYIWSNPVYQISASYLNSLDEGTYTIEPMFMVYNQDPQPLGMPSGASRTVTMTVSKTLGLTFSNQSSTSARLSVDSFNLATEIYVGVPILAEIELKSANAEYLADVTVSIKMGTGRFATVIYTTDAMRVSVPTTGTRTLKCYIPDVTLTAGTTYTLSVNNSNGTSVGDYEFTPTAAPTDELKVNVTKCQFDDNNNVAPADMYLSVDLACTSGIFGGTITGYIYKDGVTSPVCKLSDSNCVIESGKSYSYYLYGSTTALELNTTYTLRLFGIPADGSDSVQFYETTIRTGNSSGISIIVADEVEHVGKVDVYDVQGRLLHSCDATQLNINEVNANGVLIVRSAAGVSKVVK